MSGRKSSPDGRLRGPQAQQLELTFEPVQPVAVCDLPGEEELEKRAEAALAAAGVGSLGRRVRVRWNPRLRSTAGMAYAASAIIWLNPRLALFGEAEIERTLLHELAHILAHARANGRRIAPHGREWRSACRDLGLPDEARCHNLPLPRREVERRHVYRCPACADEVRRVRPFRRPVACYGCCKHYADGRYDDRFRLVKIRR